MQKYKTTYPVVSMIFMTMVSGLFFSGQSYACNYQTEIDQCREANTNTGNPNEIEDFFCPQNRDTTAQAYQVILDREFSPIDAEIDQYILDLETQKDFYYNGSQSYLDGYDDITLKLGIYGEYWGRYYQKCRVDNNEGIVQQSLTCLGGVSTITSSLDYFQDNTRCVGLMETKLRAYKRTAENILYLNNAQLVIDSQNGYSDVQKNTYSGLLDAFIFNVGLIQKISNKWISKTAEDGSQQ